MDCASHALRKKQIFTMIFFHLYLKYLEILL